MFPPSDPATPSPGAPVPLNPLVIVGAGAAGLLTAIFAARAGVPTRLLETRPRPGAKIRVSGGGRCNVLPSVMTVDDFHTEGSRNALRNVLFSWPLAQVRSFFEDELGIALYVEDTGKVFPAGVQLDGEARVVSLAPPSGDEPAFRLELESGELLRAQRVVLATGGLSLPKTGSDGAGFEFASGLGHSILPTYPALVPLLAGDARWGELAGISLRTQLRAVRDGRVEAEFEGDLLFTHKGFSGPVALDVSHRLTAPWATGTELQAHWIARYATDWNEHLRGGGTKTVERLLRDELPRRLALTLIELSGVPAERSASQLTRDERQRLVRVLDACPLPLAGDGGYRTAEVTGGGVPLAEVVTKTLESRCVPGLYFAGEVLDVTGRIGGFNFLWAWVSGRKVGQAVARSLEQD